MGFDSIWTHNRTMPSAFWLCTDWWRAAAAAGHDDVDVGIGVIPAPRMWHPGSLASIAATASLLTNGHFVLGLGTGGYGEQFWSGLGLPNRPIAIMEDYIGALRAAATGGKVAYRGKVLSLRSFSLEAAPPPIPIYLAALGPQMLRLAGRAADGALLNWASPEVIAASSRWLAEGAESAGRSRSDVRLAMYLRCCIDDDVTVARRVIAAEILEKVQPQDRRDKSGGLGYRGQFIRLGFEREIVQLEDKLARGASTSDLLDDVPEALCSAAGYYGTAADAPRRLAELTSGLDQVVLRLVPAVRDLDRIRATLDALAPDRIRAAIASQPAPAAHLPSPEYHDTEHAQ
jgi:alkanesulfonate monooxygenase SsuD/methylene tetrahydromethanopterin reductase-like flavin-dependent oxidoreductase (luciferase family)